MKFSELQLTEQTFAGIEDAGFETCMPVQERVFSHSLGGKDVMVQSQTGTGKTAAFLITIFEQYAKRPEGADFNALIIVPTRELAVQIEQDAKKLSKGLPELRVGTFFGGIGYKHQDELLKKGVDVFIGTPGRLLDYEKARKIDYKKMDVVVVDEADRLFDMGFYPDIRDMFRKMRNREERQTMLFSATLTVRARNLAWDFMNEPKEIEIEPETVTVKEINQELFHVSKSEKFSLLLRLLAKHAPESAIVFTNTKSMAVELSKRLELNGYGAHALMGDLPQQKRLQVIGKMKRGEIKFLVATDVAARGLHVDDLELVINYDIPEDFENYVHRIGRTARAGKSGAAITLACEQFVYGLEAIEEYIQMKIPVVWADEEEYPLVKDKSAHLSFSQLVRDYRGGGGRRSDSRDRSRGKQGNRNSQSHRGENRHASRPPRQQGQRSGEGRPHQGQSQGQGRKRTGQHRPKGQSASHKKLEQIEQMSFDERLAYYKNLYGGDLNTDKAKQEQQNKSSEKKSGKGNNRSGAPKDGQRRSSGSGKGKQSNRNGKQSNRNGKPSNQGGKSSSRNGSQGRPSAPKKPQQPQGGSKPKQPVKEKPAVQEKPAVKTEAREPEKKPKKGFLSKLFGK